MATTALFLLSALLSSALLQSVFAGVSEINLIALGDWGGISYRPFYTPGQVKTAAGMGVVATAKNVDFVIALGDNFYHEGVEDENSKRFAATWDNVYTAQSLQKPWYLIAGNHDHKGNVTGQIEYSKHNARWNFPAPYHAHSFRSDDGQVTLDVILLDTVDLTDSSSLVMATD